MSRQFLTLPLGLATLLCLGAVAAQPAHADITIQSISGIPASVPAAGAFVPVLIDCGVAAGIPTGTATVTDSDGKVVSHNPMGYYQKDANGDPIVYAYLVFPGNLDPTAKAAYTVTLTVADQSGSSVTRSLSVEQGFLAPIQIKSVTPSSSTLQATDRSVSVSVGVAYGGSNQGSYVRGQALLKDSAGALLENEPLVETAGTDSNGNTLFTTTFTKVPVNTSASARSYTITVYAQDNTGALSSASTYVTQLATGSPVSNLGSAGTTMTITNPIGKVGQTINLMARLRQTADGVHLSGKTISFGICGTVVGTGITRADGIVMVSYKVPNITSGKQTVTASFAGDSAYAASSVDGSLTIAK